MDELTEVLTRLADGIWAPMAYVVLALGVAFSGRQGWTTSSTFEPREI